MDEAEESKKEDTSYIVPRFNTLYNLAMEQMKFKDIGSARKSYARIVQLYNEVSASDVSYIDKQDAYQKLKIVHQQIFKPEGVITFGNVIVPIALVVVVLLIVFVAKPQLVGVTGFFTADTNTAPVWASEADEFRIQGRTQIDLSRHFTDAEGDELSYVSSGANNLRIIVSRNILTIIPDEGTKGIRFVTFAASDSEYAAKKLVKLEIG